MLTGYDELYAYDGLYRLTDQKRGTLNGTQTAITGGTFEQQWGLDATGNWKTFKQDNDGNGTMNFVSRRIRIKEARAPSTGLLATFSPLHGFKGKGTSKKPPNK